MKNTIAAALLVLSTVTASAWTTESMNKTIDQTNFIVNSGCSGTLIDLKERLVLTAHHCVDAQYETVEKEVITEDGEVKKKKIRKLLPGTVSQLVFEDAATVKTVIYRTELKAYDRENDLAVLQIKADIPNTIASKIACTAPKRGDPVRVVGNPYAVLYSSVVEGIVSSTQRNYEMIGLKDEKYKLMQISGGVVGGNSGGAVYNTDLQLIGVPVLGSRINEVIAFAVPTETIHEFMKANKLEKVLNCDG